MTDALRIDYNVPAKMRDGVTLRANVFRPADDGKYPVALTRTPYGKDYMTSFPYLDVVRLARCGYIVVIQDVRGRGDSEGEWQVFANEGLDGYDAVEWAAQLEGSNGNVGMWGFSYLSFTQWSAALQKPPHLKAIIPTFTSANFYDGVFWRGGALELGIIVHLLINSLGMETLIKRHAGQPEDLAKAIETYIAEVDRLPKDGFDTLPVNHLDAFLKTGLDADLIKELVDHPLNEKYGSLPFSLHDCIAQVEIPSYNIAGWNDIFLQNSIDCFTTLQGKVPQGEKHPHKLLIGPWSHLNYSGTIGERDYGMTASMSFINGEYDHVGLIKRWFDRWLKEMPNGAENDPPVKFFAGGENSWSTDTTWPPSRTINIPYYLRSTDELSIQPPHNAEEAHTFVYDPRNPVPTVGGAILMHPFFIPGPRDQHLKDCRTDILRFQSPALEKKLRLAGPVKLYLWATTSAPDTDFVATLLDVHPDGRAFNLIDGIIRARFRDGCQEAYLQPDVPYEFIIDLWSIAHVFLNGHRIRLDISSSNFPRWDRNLNSGPGSTPGELQVAHQRIWHDSQHPSRLVLPVLPWE